MKQGSFAFTRAPRPKLSIARQADRYRPDNEYSAAAILEDPARYGGEEALPIRWARLYLDQKKGQRNED